MSYAACNVGPYRVERTTIPEGDRGVDYTLQTMRLLAHQAAPAPELRGAGQLMAADPYAFRAFLAQHFRYEPDPPGVELLRDPVLFARELSACGWARGDCDCVTTYAAAVGLAAGLPTRFVVVAFGPWAFEHVWTEVLFRGIWVEQDVTRAREMPAGSHVVRLATVEV